MAATGLPRMTTRVLTCLFTTDSGTLTAAELVQQLQVSPASISKAVGHLEELELVRRERDPSGRRERYFVDDDVWIRAWMASARKNAVWADAIQRGAAVLGITTPAGVRLGAMGHFFAQLSDDMTGGPPPATDDALTLLVALVHAGAPLTADQLAIALDWPVNRVASALQFARSDRLSATQRAALRSASSAPSSLSSPPQS